MAREGSNPAKVANALPPYGMVRLIVPAMVLGDSATRSDHLTVLHMMMDSIQATTDDRVQLTVIDNGSTSEVAEGLAILADAGRIDRLVSIRVRRDVVAAIESELRASYEPAAVVASAAVVFRPGWVDAVLGAFEAFPECGLFSLRSNRARPWHASTSVLVGSLGAGARVGRVTSVDPDGDAGSDADGLTERSGVRLAVARGGAAVSLGFDPLVFAARREVLRTLSSIDPTGLDGRPLEVRADAVGWWCTSASRALVDPLDPEMDDAGLERTLRFVAPSSDDEPRELSPAKRATLSRLVPRSVRRVLVAAVMSASTRPGLARWVLPDLKVVQEPRSAFRVVSE